MDNAHLLMIIAQLGIETEPAHHATKDMELIMEHVLDKMNKVLLMLDVLNGIGINKDAFNVQKDG